MKYPNRFYKNAGYMLLMSCCLMCSCKKFLTVSPPSTQVLGSNVFTDDKDANSAVAGMYFSMYNLNTTSPFNGLYTTIFPGLSADEFSSAVGSNQPYLTNSIPSSDNQLARMWQDLYSIIYQANSLLQGLSSSSGVSAPLKEQLLGEGYFVRAFCYFYLVNYFGPVPLVLTPDAAKTASLPRDSVAAIYGQMIIDLKQSKNLLADDYSFSMNERVRANKWAATALLARVYLYEKDWIDAEDQASLVIDNSGMFGLSGLDSVFLSNNGEAILQFELKGVSGFTYLGQQFIPFNNAIIPNFVLSDYLVQAFEPGDLRQARWVGKDTLNGTVYYYPAKYKQTETSGGNGEYDEVLRLSEQYLIRGEARAQQGKIMGADGAESDLNVIRNRAHLANSSANTKDDMINAILHERQVELFAEWGNRWLDLKRTGLINAVLGAEKRGWKPQDVLFPIPQTEISKNPNLTQNEGY